MRQSYSEITRQIDHARRAHIRAATLTVGLVYLMLLYLIIAPATAMANNLCGVTYDKSRNLEYALRSKPSIVQFTGKKGITAFFDRKNMTLWWVGPRVESGRIITCKEKIAKNNGFIESSVEADCAGDRSGACAAQASKMRKAKY